jgi:predicted metal-binding protein
MMGKRTKSSNPIAVSPNWDSLLLICKDCRRRKDGPKHLKARVLSKAVKHQVKSSAPRARIVLTSCLKLCPTKATSVAFVTASAKPRIVAVESGGQLKKRLSELLEQRE